jgi:acyl phosphate:glycerol-3-phosphate acyltransferase
VYPATRRFRGGKGVATGGGVLLVMLPIVGVSVILLWWIVTKVTGTAAVGSIVAVLAAGVGLAVKGAPAWEFAAALGLCALVLVRHAGNMRRLVRREEPTLRTTDTRSGPRTPA